ncbi:MAG: hypothetical protein LBQ34_07220 [Alphaproteobacteria bacterium]|jgi:hypothetical protein|nr:hypothetical protein [Alphaproteobacteria bacterium]
MWTDISSIKKFISEEDIRYLEIRNISETSTKSVVFTAKYLTNLENFDDGNIGIKNIDLSSAFVEVFLAHKTLVFFADSLDLSDASSITNKYSFKLGNSNTIPLAAPDSDNYRDFLGEIVSSLLDIGEKVAYFYKDKDGFHSLVLTDSSKYSKTKLKYAITMVAKAYNVVIVKDCGIFKI